jgi:hypothetical protein
MKSKATRVEIIVIAAAALQILTYLFGDHWNPITWGYSIGQKVAEIRRDLNTHVQADSTWKSLIITKFEANAADHTEIKADVKDIREYIFSKGIAAQGLHRDH